MNGILSQTPMGVLDPRSAALLQTGLGLMAAGGPSRTPVSLGQGLGQAGMQGLQAYQHAAQAQQMEALKRQQLAQQEEEMRFRREEAARKANQPVVASPGAQFVNPNTGEVMHQVPFKPEATKPPAAPLVRDFRVGDKVVTKQWNGEGWEELSRGEAFAPKGSASGPAMRPKPPTGYRYRDDGDLEPIPGGPKDTAPKDAARAQGAVQKADTVIKKVDEALSQVGFTTTGLTGTVLGMVPGTGAFDLDKTIDTIKANLGFSELQAMREASPTGGALGQVAIQELAMLQSTVASLDKGQSEENLKRALQQVRTHFENWKNAVMQAQQGEQPAAPKRRVYNPKTGKFE